MMAASAAKNITRMFFLFIGLFFVLNLFILIIYFPPPTNTNTMMMKMTTTLVGSEAAVAVAAVAAKKDSINSDTSAQQQQQQPQPPSIQTNKDDNRPKQRLIQQQDRPKKHCPNYGCPIVPPELTPQLNQTLLNAFQQQHVEKTNNDEMKFEFASESYAMLTQQGKSHTENQDRGLFVSPFLITTTTTTSSSSSSSSSNGHDDVLASSSSLSSGGSSFLMAIFDGHGTLGHLVAQEATERFPQVLADKLRASIITTQRPSDTTPTSQHHHHHQQQQHWWEDDQNDSIVVAALNETFLQVNREGTRNNFLLGGSTGSVTLRFGSKLYIANVGDSQTILVSVVHKVNPNNNLPITTNVTFMTHKHKPADPEEKERIQRMGGNIHAPPGNPQLARVVVHSEANKDTIALAMSRSLGDWEWKVGPTTVAPIHFAWISHVWRIRSTAHTNIFVLFRALTGDWDGRQ
jgi:serine/threonine protein phosphatase PrpC